MRDTIYDFNIYFKFINNKIDEMEKIILRKKKINLTQREFSYVALIGNNPGKPFSKLIARESISKSTFSNQIKSLAKKKLVVYKDSSEDRRERRAELTEEGEKIYAIYREIREYFFKEYLSVLSMDEVNKIHEIGTRISDKIVEKQNQPIEL